MEGIIFYVLVMSGVYGGTLHVTTSQRHLEQAQNNGYENW
jgi:hypothetical protein